MLQVAMDCPFLIAPSVFSDVYSLFNVGCFILYFFLQINKVTYLNDNCDSDVNCQGLSIEFSVEAAIRVVNQHG